MKASTQTLFGRQEQPRPTRQTGTVTTFCLCMLFSTTMLARQNPLPENVGVCRNFTTFDVSGADETNVHSINGEGVVAGDWSEPGGTHGFVRAADGTITPFDAGNGSGVTEGGFINNSGAIAGTYQNQGASGYVRDPNGGITGFNAGIETFVFGIGPNGQITGTYADKKFMLHGFERTANGTIISFDVKGAGPNGTTGVGINKKGSIVGFYYDTSGVAHGFERAPGSAITTFDAQGAGKGKNQGTFPLAINASGVAAGWYIDNASASHGFVRAANGGITEFDVKGAGTGKEEGTFAGKINTPGVIAGYYVDSKQVSHGFTRSQSGNVSTFDVCGAGNAKGQGTAATGINDTGEVAGSYKNTVDGTTASHGFLGTP